MPGDATLDRAVLEIARIEYPDLDVEFWIAELDRHALAVAQHAGDGADGRRFVEAANSYLFGELGLRGNEANYFRADNSCLNRVLETGMGLPITLSVIYMEIARRLSRPVFGVGLSAHFIVRYDDGVYRTFIDPFRGGVLLHVDAEPAPSTNESITLRMLRNLRLAYFEAENWPKALEVLDLCIARHPEAVEEHRYRGMALMHLLRLGDSAAAYRRFLELAPPGPDRDWAVERLKNVTFLIACRN